MCGIFGVYSKEKAKEKVVDGLNILEHRGPDSISFKRIKDNLYLGHRRLHVMGNSDGIQPLEDDNIIYTVNGEIYDYQDLAKELNFKLKWNLDSEIISPLYGKYSLSKSFFNKINGEFAIVIYNKKEDKLHLIRDRFGIKPLYYYKNKDTISWSSEMKAFRALDENIYEFNEKVLYKVFSYQYHNENETLFKNIHQVPPGSIVTIDLNDFDVTTTTYWDFYKMKDKNCKEGNLYELLKNAVGRRIKDVNPAVALSGGIDSTLIYALMKENNIKELNSFSILFKDGNKYNEEESIDQIIDYYKDPNIKQNHKNIKVSAKDLLSVFRESIYYGEGTCINLHLPAKYLLFKEIKKSGYKVSLSGEGSDEIFFGYNHFLEAIGSKSKDDYLKGIHSLDENDTSVNNLPNIPYYLKIKYMNGLKTKTLLNNEFLKGMDENLIESITRLEDDESNNNVEKESYSWSKMCLNNYILSTLGDRMEMSHSVEGRIPFLDKEVVKFAENLRLEEKIFNGIEKYCLKSKFKEILPENVLEKKKHPFISPPVLEWDNGCFRDFFLSNLWLLDEKYIDRKQIQKCLEEGWSDYDTNLLLIYSVFILKEVLSNGKY